VRRAPVRAAGRWVAALVLLGTGVTGLANGVGEIDGVTNVAQGFVTAGVLLYGALGVPAGVGVLMKRRWGLALAAAWAVTVSLVGPAAAAFYGGQPVLSGAVLAAFLGTAAVAFVVWWLARRGVASVESIEHA